MQFWGSSISAYINDIGLLCVVIFLFWCAGQVMIYLFLGRDTIQENTLNDHIFIGLLGFVFFIKISFILALFSHFNRFSISIVVAIVMLIFVFSAQKRVSFQRQRLNFGHYIILLMSIIIGARSLSLLVGADDISYHLPYARSFLDNQSLTLQTHLIYPLHTLDINLLYALGLMIDDPHFLKLLNITFICLSCLVVYDYTARKTNCWYALIIPISLFSLEKIQYLSSVIYVDYPFTFFITVSAISFLNWHEKRDTPQALFYLVISAVAIAEAASTKYFGLVFGFLIFVFFMINSRKKINDARLFLTLCFLLGTYWYFRNIYHSGNPVHPFLSNLFGYYLWNEADLALNLIELKSHGVAQSIGHYVVEIINTGFFPILFIYFAFAFSYRQFKLTRENTIINANFLLASLSILYTIFWYFTAHVDRYLLPIICLALANIAFSLYLLLDKIKYNILIKLVIILLVTYQLWVTVHLTIKSLEPYPLQIQSEKMRQLIPGFALMEHANTIKLPNHRIYQVGFATAIFYYKGVAAGHWMGATRWSFVANTQHWKIILKPAIEIKHYLNNNNFDAFIVSKKESTYDLNDLKSQFHLVFEDKFGFIFRPKE